MKKLMAVVVVGLMLVSLSGCPIIMEWLGLDIIEVGGTVTLDASISPGHSVWVGLLKAAPFEAPSDVTTWTKYQQLSLSPGSNASYSFTDVKMDKYIIGAFYDVNDNGVYDQGEPAGGYPAPGGNPLYDFTEDFSQANVTVAFSQAVTGDAQAVATDKAALAITFAGGDSAAAVTQNLTLPTSGASGTAVAWTSTSPGIISAGGVVTRPAAATSVTLIAAITKGSASDAKLFTLTVLSLTLTDAEAVVADKASLAITYSGGDSATGVTVNVGLPTSGPNGTTVTWISSNESLISTLGVVTRPQSPTSVILTAVIARGGVVDTKSFVLTVLQETLTDAQAVAADKAGLQIVYAAGDTSSAVTGDLGLSTSGANGTTIVWNSSNTAVVSTAGVVARPTSSTTVTLTATILKGAVTDQKAFAVTVLQAALTDSQAVAADKAALKIDFAGGDAPDAVTSSLTLATTGANGTAIVWNSSNTAVVSATGVVTRPAATTTLTLVAAISRGSANDVKIFTLTVLQVSLTDAQAVAADASALEIGFSGSDTAGAVTDDLTLPSGGTNGSAISWTTTNATVVGATGVVTRPAATTTVTLTATITRGSARETRTFSVTVVAAPLTDAQAVATDKASLEITFASGDTAAGVTADLTLPTFGANGTTITWSSETTGVVSNAGVVTRPATATVVTLTATITRGTASDTKDFPVTVLADVLSDAEAVAADADALQITYTPGDSASSVTGNLALAESGANGSVINWASSDEAIVGITGVVTRPVLTTDVTLTATVSKDAANDTRVFVVTVILAAPSTPTGLAVGNPTGSTLDVSWNLTPGAASYQLYRNGGQIYGGAAAAFADQNLNAGTTCSYAVRATNDSGSSALSSPVTGTTSFVTPTLSVGTPTGSSLNVSWTGVSGATGYQVFRDASSTGSFATSAYNGTGTSFTDSALGGGTTYYYKIKATYPAGTSTLSATPASGTTSIVIPAGLTVGSHTPSSLTVSWTGVTGAISYQVFRDTSTTGSFTTSVYNGTGTSFVDSGLPAGTYFYYKVQATYPAGTSSLSAAAYDNTVIPTPSNPVVGGATESSLAVSWQLNGAISCQLRRDTSATGTFATIVYSGAATSFTDTGLAALTTYYYKLTGTWPAGGSGFSGAGHGTTLGDTVATPTFSPAAGTYASARTVTIASTSGASIRYTTDGTTPTATTGTLYSTPVSVTTSKTLKAIAYKTGYNNSAAASAQYHIMPPGLVAWYTFAGNVNDSSGNGRHGTPVGSLTYTTDRKGVAGSALQLNGTNQYVTLPTATAFDLYTFTLYAIVKVPDFSNNNIIISKPSSGGYGNYTMRILATQGKGSYVHDTASGNWTASITPSALPTNTYVHLAVTVAYSSGEYDYQAYYNGAATSGYAGATAPARNNNQAVIGAITSFGALFEGVIDEVLVFNWALSSAGISTVYAALQ